MKKLYILICLSLFTLASAQNSKQIAPVYHKVKIEGDASLTQTLLKLGLTIDHAERKENSIITEIADEEVAILKQNHIQYTVLISDMANFYAERAKQDYINSSKTTALPNCNYPSVKKPSNFHLGSMGGFYTYSEFLNIIDSMAILYPTIIKAKAAIDATQSIEGRTLWYLKISDNPNVDESESEVLYSAVHHAREPASLSQLIFYMWYLLENYSTNADVKFLVDNTELFFVPCVNPDGYIYNYTTNPGGGGMWRKNRRNNGGGTFGVDINRNYGYNWGYDNTGSSPTPSSDTYRGTAAFSEPETQAMKNFCNGRQFKVALNAHTYSNLLIYPWGYLPSYYTPDSATFVNWGVLMCETSRFLYGTGDQTVMYVTNGDSDDWMYGEQTSKAKIMSMTPEAGSANDGFWPVASRITDICKTTFNQNINLAKVVTNFAMVRDDQDRFIPNNGYIKYNIQRLGLTAGNFSVSVVPVGTGLATTGAPKIYTGMTQNQTIADSISFTLSGSLAPGQTIKYCLAVDNGFYTHYDTLSKIYGTPVIVLNDACNATSNWTAGGWAVSTTKFKSAPGSITDSPFGNYSNNQNKNISLSSNLNLSGATYAHLQYWTKFKLEKNYDFVQVYGSTNSGSTWSTLCARYETAPSSFGGTDPVYDGLQDGWVKEEIDLTPYVGGNLMIRFNLTTDPGATDDGFYFDDFLVRKLNGTVGIQNLYVSEGLSVYPNPSSGKVAYQNQNGQSYEVRITNNLGQEVVRSFILEGFSEHTTSDLSGLASGLYFITFTSGNEHFVQKLVLSTN
jgi:carboxypeptidase T